LFYKGNKNMISERYPVALISGVGLGIVKEEHLHYAIIEFNDGKNKWSIVAYDGEYQIIDDISIGYEEIE